MGNGEIAPKVLIEEIDSTINRIQNGDETAIPDGVILLLRCQKVNFGQTIRYLMISGVTAAVVSGAVAGIFLALGR